LMILKNVPAFYYGTSPNKFFDYISAGIPVLNNYPGWLADLIHQHQCGVVVPPDDPAAFADALEALATDPERCRSMGQNARQLAESHFSREKLAAQFVSFLEEQHSSGGSNR
jgi:glycosyltransferase involved in cell wall biosynthesis